MRAARQRLLSRRAALLRLAGGTLAGVFPLHLAGAVTGAPVLDDPIRWRIIAAVQDHLLPSEPHAPGAQDIHALAYLQWVASDSNLDTGERAFIVRGAAWLDERARDLALFPFTELNESRREQVLRAVSGSAAGENWLGTILVYLFEALLMDPVYGGNPDGIGWRWLGHTPGFPRPPAARTYGRLGYS